MDRKKFYAALRRRGSGVFGTSLSQGQVDGIENLLNVWEEYFADGNRDELAYDLATAYHETAHTMQPIKERGQKSYFNKYEPGTRIGNRLGNIVKGDGYRFRGEGHVQNTGRRNARKATEELNKVFGLGIDLVANPQLRGDPKISALSLFLGNRQGWWTQRDLLDYLDGLDEDEDEDYREFVKARYVVNGTDKAQTIAGYAMAFDRALKEAGYEPKAPRKKPASAPKPLPRPDTPEPKKRPSAGRKTGIAALIAAVAAAVYTFLKSKGLI